MPYVQRARRSSPHLVAHAAGGWGQVWSGNRCSYRAGMDPTPPRQSRQGATQAGLFNRVCRQTALTRTTSTFPGIARWVTWCYQHPSALRFGAAAIQSAGGVQQGDPLGPLLFATAIHTLTQELRAGPLDLALFYLDDGFVAGDVAAVGAALAHIRTRGSELSLTLNLSKCEVVGVGGVQPDDLTDHFPAELLQHANGSSRLQRNFEFLGAAIGDDGFVQAHTQGRVDAVRPLLEALSALGDAQVGVRLLRTCASYGRVWHSMRCNPPHCQLTALQQFDSVVQAAFSSITGLHLTAQQYEQAARSLSLAGFGLRSSAVDCPAAYLASVGGTAIACEELDSAYVAAAVVLAPAVAQATAALNTRFAAPAGPGRSVEHETKCPRQTVGWSLVARPVSNCFAHGESFAPLRRRARSTGLPGCQAGRGDPHGQCHLCDRTSSPPRCAGGRWWRVVPTMQWHPWHSVFARRYMRGRWGKKTPPHSCAWRHLQMGGQGWASAGQRTCWPSSPTTAGRCWRWTSTTCRHILAEPPRLPCCAWFGHHGPTAAGGRGTGSGVGSGGSFSVCCQESFVLSKGFASSPWWPNLPEPGTVRSVTSCFRFRGAPQHELKKTLVSSMGTYFRNSVSSCGATGRGQCYDAVLNWLVEDATTLLSRRFLFASPVWPLLGS